MGGWLNFWMHQNTPFLPGISHRLCGRQRRSQLDQLRAQSEQWRQSSLSRLCEIFGPWLPPALLAPTATGTNSRQRTYPLPLTFWAFLSQVLSPGSSCREAVRKIQAWYAPQEQTPASGTSTYCQARRRLPLAALTALHQTLADKLSARLVPADLWLGRRVKLVDGTGVSMPDTAANQKDWPQPATQKPGCGFPVVKLVACFCLASGALLHWVEGTLKEHDCRLLLKRLAAFQKGDVVLADRGFSSYASLATLRARGVDAARKSGCTPWPTT